MAVDPTTETEAKDTTIADLKKASKAEQAAREKLADARIAYELALVTAKDAGHSYNELAEASELSAPRIQQIVRARRPKNGNGSK